jgi:hypothetical protein
MNPKKTTEFRHNCRIGWLGKQQGECLDTLHGAPASVDACGNGIAKFLKPAKDPPMKLNSALVERTLNQFDAQAIPENHPVVPQLNSLFGDHTFFLDGSGLSIVEPTEADNGAQKGQVVKLAGWQDSDRTSLVPHEPEPTNVLVELEEQGGNSAA